MSVRLPGGSKIFRHAVSKTRRDPVTEKPVEPIPAHIEAHLGQVECVYQGAASDAARIDIHVVAPTERFPFVRLVTSGMSDQPMTVPEGTDAPKFAELMVSLPPDWKLDRESFEDPKWYWPVALLKSLAQMPRKQGTWLGFGHTVPNGDPAEEYAPGVGFCSAIILPSPSSPGDFDRLQVDGKEIVFYSVVPLYREEMNLKLRADTDALLMRLTKNNVSDLIVPGRPNVGKKKLFGLF